MVFGRSKVEEEETIPDGLIDAIAERVLKRYDVAFADLINKIVSEKFRSLEERIATHEAKLERLEEIGNERLKDMVRSILEVQTENIANKAAERAVLRVGVDRVNKIEREITKIQEMQVELAENIGALQDTVKSLNSVVSTHKKKLEEIKTKLEDADERLEKAVELFEERVSEAVVDTTKKIKEAITVDRNKIIAALRDLVVETVNARMKEVVDEFTMVADRFEEIGKNIGRLIDIADSMEVLSAKISDLEKEIHELKSVISASRRVEPKVEPETSVDDEELETLAKEAKEHQDRVEKDLEEDWQRMVYEE